MSEPSAVASARKLTTSTAPLLAARDVYKSFGLTEALRSVSLDITPGEILAIMGPSGSGKSTLLHVLAGILTPDKGTVNYEGESIGTLNETDRAKLRLANFGFIFQFGQLLPDLSAADNVSLPLLLENVPRKQALDRSREWLDRLGLANETAKLPGELSGGQAQRVAVARALVTNPKVIFADEPTGSLDSLAAEHVMNALTAAAREQGTTVVVVTHDPRTAAYADREVVVRDGRISAGGLSS